MTHRATHRAIDRVRRGGIIGVVLLLAPAAAAAEGGGNWRSIYDVVMLWVNFGILAFLLIRFLRQPIRDFFETRTDEVATEIRRIEDRKKAAEAKVLEARQQLAELQHRLGQIQSRIVKEGEAARDTIIEEARAQSRYMLEEAGKRIENKIRQARQRLRAELIDAAVALALERLPEEVTDADNRRFIEQYLKAAG